MTMSTDKPENIMKRISSALAILLLLAAAPFLSVAAERRVVKDNPLADYPYDTWSNAAASIQMAIDDADPGDTILVTNGVYDVGGRPVAGGSLTNRVVIDKAVSVMSLSTNPADTVIVGAWDSDTSWTGDKAIRGVYLIEGAFLAGFTITNGGTRAVAADDGRGGGIWAAGAGATVSNSVIVEGLAHQYGVVYRGTYSACTFLYANGGSIRNAYNATLHDCWVSGRYPAGYYDGGLGNCTVYRTTITRGWMKWGGGASGGVLRDCLIYNCQGGTGGGGAYNNTLFNCVVSNNQSRYGGGAYSSTVYSSVIDHNTGTDAGQGAIHSSTLYNCLLVGNKTSGAFRSKLYNCTVVGNLTGLNGCTNVNTVSWYNRDGNYLNNPVFTNACTYPEQAGWVTGNITQAPQFVSYDPGSGFGLDHVPGDYRLAAGSPCTEKGLNFAWMQDPGDARSRDLDGNPRILPRGGRNDIGAFERNIPLGTILGIR